MSTKLSRKLLRFAAVASELSQKSLKKAGGAQPKAKARHEEKELHLGTDYTVVITGGNRGVGYALAKGFAELGADVAIICRDPNAAKKAAGSIGENVSGYGADISQPIDVKKAFKSIGAELGELDLLINGAGVTGPLQSHGDPLDAEAFQSVLNVNVTGAWSCAIEAAKRMRPGSRIVNISSGAVDTTQPGMGAYAVSKHGIEGLTKQLAQDFEDEGIAVCTIRLGSLRTEMTEKAFGKLKASLLPEPETMMPAFMALAQAPTLALNGKSFAGWRMLADINAELATGSPLTTPNTFEYPTYVHQGRQVDRESRDFRVYDRAENQFGPSPKVAETLAQDLLHRPIEVYPDQGHDRLQSALAQHYDLTPQHFAIGNGSWEILDRLLELFTTNGDTVVASKPGWFGFNLLAGKRGINVVKVPMRETQGIWDHNLEAVAQAVSASTRLIYLISPSNPEGVALKRSELVSFLDRLPKGLPVILDEAYFEYVDDPDAISGFEVLDRTDRMIFGLRTFSKFYALASMRVGYAYGRPETMDLLRRGERIFNISHLSEKAAITALTDEVWQDQVRTNTLSERMRIQQALSDMGLDYIPSQAPFLLLELPTDLDTVVDRFAEEGIFIGRKSFYKQKYLLLPISTEAENTRHLSLLQSLCG